MGVEVWECWEGLGGYGGGFWSDLEQNWDGLEARLLNHHYPKRDPLRVPLGR